MSPETIAITVYIVVSIFLAGFIDGEKISRDAPALAYSMLWPLILAGLILYIPYALGKWISPSYRKYRLELKQWERNIKSEQIEREYQQMQSLIREDHDLSK